MNRIIRFDKLPQCPFGTTCTFSSAFLVRGRAFVRSGYLGTIQFEMIHCEHRYYCPRIMTTYGLVVCNTRASQVIEPFKNYNPLIFTWDILYKLIMNLHRITAEAAKSQLEFDLNKFRQNSPNDKDLRLAKISALKFVFIIPTFSDTDVKWDKLYCDGIQCGKTLPQVMYTTPDPSIRVKTHLVTLGYLLKANAEIRSTSLGLSIGLENDTEKKIERNFPDSSEILEFKEWLRLNRPVLAPFISAGVDVVVNADEGSNQWKRFFRDHCKGICFMSQDMRLSLSTSVKNCKNLETEFWSLPLARPWLSKTLVDLCMLYTNEATNSISSELAVFLNGWASIVIDFMDVPEREYIPIGVQGYVDQDVVGRLLWGMPCYEQLSEEGKRKYEKRALATVENELSKLKKAGDFSKDLIDAMENDNRADIYKLKKMLSPSAGQIDIQCLTTEHERIGASMDIWKGWQLDIKNGKLPLELANCQQICGVPTYVETEKAISCECGKKNYETGDKSGDHAGFMVIQNHERSLFSTNMYTAEGRKDINCALKTTMEKAPGCIAYDYPCGEHLQMMKQDRFFYKDTVVVADELHGERHIGCSSSYKARSFLALKHDKTSIPECFNSGAVHLKKYALKMSADYMTRRFAYMAFATWNKS